MTDTPTLTLLSLGAGVQSTAVLVLSARGQLPRLDGAIFSDTGWEPQAVYDHLDRLEREVARPAGIPIYRVSQGNIRADALDPDHRFASMPLFVRNPDGGEGMTRRQCTGEYKLKPIKRQVRALLGYPHPVRVPRGVFAEQWIGISTDEADRALGPDGQRKAGDVRYARNTYPLLDLGLSRADCQGVLTAAGFDRTPKSACVGCPFHTNRQWRYMRDHDPAAWADAVDFDSAIRAGNARATARGDNLMGQAYLHRTRLPLAVAPIDHVTSTEWTARQADLVSDLSALAWEERLTDDQDAQLGGCSPFGCTTDTDPEE